MITAPRVNKSMPDHCTYRNNKTVSCTLLKPVMNKSDVAEVRENDLLLATLSRVTKAQKPIT